MEELTLRKAKNLSEKKWQHIVDNNGSESNLDIALPKLTRMSCKCAMCEFHLNVQNKSCDDCLYTDVCDDPYSNYLTNRSKETALVILEAIKTANKSKSKKQ